MSRAERDRTIAVCITVACGVCLIAGFAASSLEAHKAVTSPYTYNEHVFPILRDRCGRCHVEGGPAPMSLLTYREKDGTGGAFAWAESIREMLVAEAMPPWYADPRGPAVKHSRAVTPRELDIVVTWASGGTPEGDPVKKPVPPPPLSARWALGRPDLILQMPSAHEVAAGALEDTLDVTLPTNLTETKWVKAADLLPGSPMMVRRADISSDDGKVLAVWEPGDDPSSAPAGTAFRLPAAAKIQLRLFYKKPWQKQQEAMSDRSSIGLYFTSPPLSGASIDTFTIDAGGTAAGSPALLARSLATPARVLAIRAQLDQPYDSIEIAAVGAGGHRVALLQLHAARPEWPRRYWLVDPVELPAGTKIEVTGKPGDSDRGPLLQLQKLPLRVALDIAPLS